MAAYSEQCWHGRLSLTFIAESCSGDALGFSEVAEEAYMRHTMSCCLGRISDLWVDIRMCDEKFKHYLPLTLNNGMDARLSKITIKTLQWSCGLRSTD